jgi:O-succinylbenzoate synthase
MITFKKYSIPFKSPLRTAIGTFSHREGIIVTFEYRNKAFVGEAAPLPGFSSETIEDVEKWISIHKDSLNLFLESQCSSLFLNLNCVFTSDWTSEWGHYHISEKTDVSKSKSGEISKAIRDTDIIGDAILSRSSKDSGLTTPIPPSVAFAIDSIRLQILWYKASDPDAFYTEGYPKIHRCIIGPPHFSSFPENVRPIYEAMITPPLVPVNITSSDIEVYKSMYEKGFRSFKIKVGFGFDEDIARVSELRELFPDATIRLDANAKWSVEEAERILPKLAEFNIDYIEQPVSVDNLFEFGAKLAEYGIPIAADESMRSIDDVHRIIESKASSVLILKPMLIGSFSNLLKIRSVADAAGLKTVVTTSLEAGIGRRTTALLTSAMFSSDHAHGLATGSMFPNVVLDDTELVYDGCYHPEPPESTV